MGKMLADVGFLLPGFDRTGTGHSHLCNRVFSTLPDVYEKECRHEAGSAQASATMQNNFLATL